MNRRNLVLVIGLALAGGTARADLLTYAVHVDTSGIPAGAGYIELQFNQANALTSGVGVATVTQFVSTGYTLGGAASPSAGVTGSFASPPLVIPNDVSAANYYDETVNMWGQSFSFLVTLDTTATDSGFFVYLLDTGFVPIAGPLGSGEVANVIIDSAGVATPQGSNFEVGFAEVSSVPEPSAVWLLATAVGGVALMAFGGRHSRGSSQSNRRAGSRNRQEP
jgi:hypothetical protein